MNGDGADRRRFRRFPIAGSVRLYSGTQMWQTELVDLSLRGVLVSLPEQWQGQPGSRFRLDVRLEGGLMIGMGVELVRVRAHDLAFSCQKIDLDSFTRLKRLVELNVGNVAVLNRELEVLLER
jgi:hypothetical protein